jgi:hypothetical protein
LKGDGTDGTILCRSYATQSANIIIAAIAAFLPVYVSNIQDDINSIICLGICSIVQQRSCDFICEV